MSVQIGLVASQFSLPMLAPLLFGTGILLRSIRTNASLIFPRIGVVVVLLWMLWFFNSVVQNTVVYLRRQVLSRAASITRRMSSLYMQISTIRRLWLISGGGTIIVMGDRCEFCEPQSIRCCLPTVLALAACLI